MSVFSPNKNLEEPAHGSYNNDWDIPVNSNWTGIDTSFGGSTQISVTGIGAGTYALTIAQYQPPNIVFSGVLGANLVYVVPAGVGGMWSVLNSTSGAFSLTFGSSGGSSVVLPQGRRGLVVTDGALLQFADSNSLAAAEAFATAADVVVLSTAEAFATTAANNAQSAAQTFATGAANTAQSNAEAFTTAGFAPLANAHLTGVPTVPTAAPGTNTTQAASTAFVEAILATGLLSGNGYLEIPVAGDTWIIQWGIGTFLSTGSAVNFPIAFPVACFMAISNAYGSAATAFTQSVSTTQITAVNGISGTSSWIAIGH